MVNLGAGCMRLVLASKPQQLSEGQPEMIEEVFSTRALPSQYSRAQEWENANRSLLALDFKAKPREAAFDAHFRVCSAGPLRFSALEVSSHICSVSGRRGSGTKPYHLIAQIRRGRVAVQQDGREALLDDGDFVIVDTSRPFQIDTKSMQVRSVDLSSHRLRDLLPQIDGLTARTLKADGAATAMLHGMIDNLFDYAGSLPDGGADYVAEAVHYATAGALAGLAAAQGIVPKKRDSWNRHRIRLFVRANLRDRTLNPESIARLHDLSLRGLHKLFEDEDTTLMKWIWSERILCCHEDLIKPQLRNRSISEIAYSWGFSDAAHFSRLYRAQIGESPREIRRQALLQKS